MTKVLAPPEIFENTTTFVPRVPGPTSRPFETNTFPVVKELLAKILFETTTVPTFADVAKTFVAVTELLTTRFAKFDIVTTFRVPTFAVVAKTFVV
jgi:hypothetical protein